MRDFEQQSGITIGRIVAGVVGFFALLIGTTIVFGSWYTIDQRERGVILRNGKLVGTATPGLGFKLPLVDSVIKIPLESQKFTYDKMSSYSRDQQEAKIRISVILHATENGVDELYTQYGSLQGYVDRRLTPKVQADSKIVFGRFNADTAIRERGRFNTEVETAIREAVQSPEVVIEAVQVEDIDFSDAYEKSIEQRMLAEVEVQKVRQNAEREKIAAEIAVTQAKGRADSVRAEAQAQADAIKLRGEAEAAAIQARGKALGDNPHLVTLVQAERWDGKLPVTMVPSGSVPMITLGR